MLNTNIIFNTSSIIFGIFDFLIPIIYTFSIMEESDKPKPKRKLQSANRLRKKEKKLTMEEMPEMVEFKKLVDKGDMSKEEKVEHLKKMMDSFKK